MQVLADHLIHLLEYAACKNLPIQATRPQQGNFASAGEYLRIYKQIFEQAGVPFRAAIPAQGAPAKYGSGQ